MSIRVDIGEALERVAPVTPAMGPPLPSAFNIRWPPIVREWMPNSIYGFSADVYRARCKLETFIAGRSVC